MGTGGTAADQTQRNRRALEAHAAFRAGDLDRLRRALGERIDPLDTPLPQDLGLGSSALEYAIYWSPVAFVATLLAAGADPNYQDHAGFPSLIAALTSGRPETLALMALLLDHGADPDCRGLNDWTPLHVAVAHRHLPALALLIERGADPRLATRIDDCTTPLEDAEALGFDEAAQLLRHSPGDPAP